MTETTEAPRVLRWETLTKKQFDAIDPAQAVILLTCSPLEVHGPHLPTGADALQGEGLAERMLRFLPSPHRERTFLKLPFIYTATDVVPQSGSLHFHPSTTVRVLTELGCTLAAQGFRDVLISNFHGGPRHFLAIEKACTRANRAARASRANGRPGLRMASLFSLLISRLTEGSSELGDVLGHLPGVEREHLDGDTHGGLVETSQLLALCGQWVDPGYAKLPRTTVSSWLDSRSAKPSWGPLGRFKDGLAFFQDETYSGAPAGASAELGEQILDVLGEKAAEAAAELLDGRIGPEDCHSPIWPYRFVFLHPLMIRVANRLLGFRNPIA